MSRTLILVRHAEAAQSEPDLKDFDRPLTNNGYMNATKMGRYIMEEKTRINLIVSSPAERARQTALNIAEQLKYNTEKIYWNEDLYNASVRTMLELVNRMQVENKVILVVGHNPSITYFAEYITGEAIGDMATCGVVEITFNLASWSEVSEGTGSFKEYIEPAQIESY